MNSANGKVPAPLSPVVGRIIDMTPGKIGWGHNLEVHRASAQKETP